ncbi:Uncharacterized protein TCM_025979 [Theobroma cacao]|uniref:Uncharacterized protein n=1 Tax=Theobroma cacao TaxID=3641 RepID=A0A061F884_THECC|nr:Uncharacterized protein TCM_025979 [Theobroma cacao]
MLFMMKTKLSLSRPYHVNVHDVRPQSFYDERDCKDSCKIRARQAEEKIRYENTAIRDGNDKRGTKRQGREKVIWESRQEELSIFEQGNQQSRLLQAEVMEADLAKLEVQMRDSAETLMAAREAADLTESEFALLIRRRNGLMDNLMRRKNKFLKMKGIEAFLMLKLGFL